MIGTTFHSCHNGIYFVSWIPGLIKIARNEVTVVLSDNLMFKVIPSIDIASYLHLPVSVLSRWQTSDATQNNKLSEMKIIIAK
jgi:hypothetical protein